MAAPIIELDLYSTELEPLHDNVLVNPEGIEREKTTESGIVLQVKQTTTLARPVQGVVISVGPDVQSVKPGNVVIWPITDGLDYVFNDGPRIILKEKSVVVKKS